MEQRHLFNEGDIFLEKGMFGGAHCDFLERG